MVMVGFLNKLLQKDKKKEYQDEMKKSLEPKKTKTPETKQRTKTFDKFVQKAETKKKISEWMRKWKYKKRGVMALLYILWLQGDSDKKVISMAKDILSKLKGEDIFAKFLNVLKLKPEEKMD